jgi:hypothetical protein
MKPLKPNGQHQKILNICAHGGWVCQREFWQISKSPHKRREDLEKRGYVFEPRPCAHGTPNSRDYRLIPVPKPPPAPPPKPTQHVTFVEKDGQRVAQLTFV